MKRSNRLVLLVGVFLAVLAFVGIVIITSGNSSTNPPPKEATTLPTVIAAKDIPLGTTITADMLGTQTLDVNAREAGAFQDPSQAIGQVARTTIKTGAQVGSADFSTAETGCGTIDVPAGLRAMSVQVDQVSGVGTVINTGDYVDMVVGFTGDKFPVATVNPQDQSISVVSGLNGTSVKLLLQGLQVLCRQLPPPTTTQAQQPAPSEGTGGQPTTSLNGQQEIVILGVNPTQSEVIKFAQLDGSITLVLRSAKDFVDANGNPIVPEVAATEGITLKKLTTDFAVPIPELVEAILPKK